MKKVKFKFKPAFTMLELVFVIVILGILAAILIPKMQGSRLVEAADQIVSHIRYTQHLAMQDDKYENDNVWYRKRWQIVFSNDANTGNLWAYTIFSDSNGDGGVTQNEIAKNPQNTNKLLTGGINAAISSTSSLITSEFGIENKYGITGVVFGANCNNNNNQRIVFDYLGRPMIGNPFTYASAYPAGSLLTGECVLTITNNAGERADISIEPETGFASITALNLN